MEGTKAQSILLLIGRILISAVFIAAGFHKLFNFAGTAAFIASKGLPLSDVGAAISILIEVGGAFMILIGWKPRIGAILLLLFTLFVTFIFHPFWAFEPSIIQNQMDSFMKNLAIIGALFYVIAFGTGRYSLELRW